MKIKIVISLLSILFTFQAKSEEYFIPIIKDDPYILFKKDDVNLKNDQKLKFIYRDLFDLHFNTWKEEFLRQTAHTESKYNNIDKDSLEKNKILSEEELSSMIIKLNEVINEKNNSSTYAEASFKLALYSYINKKIDAEKAREIVENGLKELKNYKDNIKLYVRMNLFAGDLALLKEKYKDAKNYYINIISKELEDNEFREDIIRSYIGLGDSEFETYHFQEAKIAYENALKFSKKFIGYSEDKYALLIAEIKLRHIWASYRNAEYVKAVEYIQDFSRERGRYENLISKLVMDDVVRVGALSLYESKQQDFYIKLAKDKAAGDYVKRMIINSFYYFTAAGYPNNVEEMAKQIEKEFYSSRLLPEFVKSRLVALEKAENYNKYNELAYFGTAFIAKDSLWKNRFSLNDVEEENRRNMIENLSLQSAQYYFKLGLATKSRSEFLKSAQIYHARILENFPEDLRGVLFQSFGQSLFMAKDYNEAWIATEESLNHPLDEYSLKISWFQLANIARAQSEDSKVTDSVEFKKYEKAVDGFIAHFPNYSLARNYLFESAKRAELLNDFENSRKRYEKILSLSPLEDKEQAQEEKDKVSLNLANLLKKMGGKEKNTSDEAGSLERIAKEYKVSEAVSSVIEITNYSIALEHFNSLKEKGEFYTAAKFIELWGKNYKYNENSREALLLALSELALLQKWEQVNNLADYFIENREYDKKINTVYYWKARALDALLQFSIAANYYTLSANNADDFPELKTKILALKRASEIYQYLNINDKVPEILEKLSKLESQVQNNTENYENTEIQSAYKYLEAKNYSVANKIFKNILQHKNLSNLKSIEANIGLLTTELYLAKNRAISEANFDKYIENKISKISNYQIKNSYLRKAVMILNDFDYFTFNKDSERNFDKFNINNLVNMNMSKDLLLKRINYLNNIKASEFLLAKTYMIYGKMTLKLSDSYAQLYKFQDKKDNYLVNADKFQSESKKYLYLSLSYAKGNLNEQDNIELSSLISRFDNRRFEVNLKSYVADKSKFFEILNYIPTAMGLNSNKYELGSVK